MNQPLNVAIVRFVTAHISAVFGIPKNEGVLKLRNLQYAMLPIVHLHIQTNAKYSDIIGMCDPDINIFIL